MLTNKVWYTLEGFEDHHKKLIERYEYEGVEYKKRGR